MKNLHKLAALGAAIALVAGLTGCNKLKARDQLNKGVLAFRNAQYAQAVDHFQQSVQLDPTLVNAKVFLATAMELEYVPGGATPENVKKGENAIQAFENVLATDPNNTNAIGSIAQIYYQMNNYPKAKEYQEKLMKIEPNNPDPYYWVGVLDYVPCQRAEMELRTKLKLTTLNIKDHDSYPPLPEKARAQLEQQNGALVAEGIRMLQKAIDLKPNYGNAYSYLNLMYRQRAELATSKEDREADLVKADQLASKALALMKSAGAQAQQGSAGAS